MATQQINVQRWSVTSTKPFEIGAQIFRYYPYLAGEYIPHGTELLQITSDPNDAGAAAVGHSLLGDTKLTLESLIQLVPQNTETSPPTPLPANAPLPSPPNSPLTANEAFAALSELRRNTPAAVGIALAQQKSRSSRAVIAFIGDGSLQYSVQSLYTAAQHHLRLIYIVLCNDEYATLKEFAVLENTPNVPALDLPGLDIVSTAKGFGCIGVQAKTNEELKIAFAAALKADGPTVIAIPIKRERRPLVPS
ncbi:MAG: mdlC [Bryobacterales bacterium]|nr:mdlC [Bryobacterales bacterium]